MLFVAVAAVLGTSLATATPFLEQLYADGSVNIMQPYRLHPIAWSLPANGTSGVADGAGSGGSISNASTPFHLPLLHSSVLAPANPTVGGAVPDGYWGVYVPYVVLLDPPTSLRGTTAPTRQQLVESTGIAVAGREFRLPPRSEALPTTVHGGCATGGVELIAVPTVAGAADSAAALVAAVVTPFRVTSLFWCDAGNSFFARTSDGGTLQFTSQVRHSWLLTSLVIGGVGDVTFHWHSARRRASTVLRSVRFTPTAQLPGVQLGGDDASAPNMQPAVNPGASFEGTVTDVVYDSARLPTGAKLTNRVARVVTALLSNASDSSSSASPTIPAAELVFSSSALLLSTFTGQTEAFPTESMTIAAYAPGGPAEMSAPVRYRFRTNVELRGRGEVDPVVSRRAADAQVCR